MTGGHRGGGNPAPPKRGEVRGWTQGAVRRHTRWLRSVETDLLDDGTVGYAVTVTIRETPFDAAEWQSLRRDWWKALEYRGLVRGHWVVEWQARGVPHLHCALYFDPTEEARGAGASLGEEALALWVVRAGPRFGAAPAAQHWAPIEDALGWEKYLSKHAARGVAHYQRWGKPEGWEKTGRLWGYTGSWPLADPDEVDVPWPVYWRIRRQVRAWRLADARTALRRARTPEEARTARRRIAYARRMLKSPDQRLSAARGVSEWIPQDAARRVVDFEQMRPWLELMPRGE